VTVERLASNGATPRHETTEPGQDRIGLLTSAALWCAIGTLALGGVAIGDARAAVQPSAGSPDLSQMALRVTDLPPGTTVRHEGYLHEKGYVAAYDREFGRTRVGAARLVSLESEVVLDKTADEASLTFFELQVAVAQKSVRAQLGRDTLTAIRGQPSVRVRRVTVGKPRTLHIGDGAVVLPATLRTSLGRIHAAFVFGVLDRVETAMVAVAAPGSRLTATDLAPLIAATADHVRAGLSPINSAPPTVSGTAQQGQTLTAAPGAWSNAPVSFAYQWQRCDANGAACTAIVGATGQSYNIGAADAGATLRVAVTASNKVGHAVAASPQTPVVPST
jgi:hypothetical protein